MGCGGFHPQFDFDGRPVQCSAQGAAPLELIAFNLTALNGRSVALLAWVGWDGLAEAFVESFARVSEPEKAAATIRLTFEHLENVFMKPSWWRGLPEGTRAATIARMRSGFGQPGTERKQECLRPDGHSYVTGVATVDAVAR